MHINRHSLLGGVAALLVVAGLGAGEGHAQGEVRVSSWGGSFQAAEREAIFKPFEESAGIRVVEDSGPTRLKIKTMVESGNVQWDVAEVAPGDYLALVKEGLLEEIDYSYFDEETLKQLPETARLKYGVEGVSYSRVIAWNTNTFPAGKPQPSSWVDVWDVEKFPGARMIDAGDYPNAPFEYALMADGVQPSELSPPDLDRAFESLAKIRPHVVKWSTTSAMGPEALVSGEADIAIVSNNRIEALKKSGAPVDYTFNQGALIKDYLVIPKGAANYENAMKFIAAYMKAEGLARLMQIQPLGPSNPAAFATVPEEIAKTIPTYSENQKRQVVIDYGWWLSTDPATGKSWREVSIDRWHEFVLKR